MQHVMLLYAHLADNELIRRKVKMGQADCYEVLMRRHNRTLYRIGKMYGLDDATTEELMQEAHLLSYQLIHQFDPAHSYRKWISAKMARLCRQHLQQAHDRTEPAGYGEGGEEETVLAEPVVAFTRTPALQQHLEQLPFSLRAPVMLCEIEGFSVRDAAELLELRQDVLAGRLEEAKAQLSGRLLKWYHNSDVFLCHADCNDRVVAAVLQQLG